MKYTTIKDLSADVMDGLGIGEMIDEEISRSDFEDCIRRHVRGRYEDIGDDELDRILRAVWDELIGEPYPWE